MLSRPWRRPLIAPQLECPQTMMSRTSSKPTANSMAAASDSSPTERPSGAAGETMLPGLRTTNRSPGSVEANTLIATRVSEQAMKSTSGFWPSARRAKVSRAMGRTRLRKSTMPWTSLRIPWLLRRRATYQPAAETSSGLHLRCKQIDLLDLGRLRQELARALHQRGGDRAVEVRLPALFVGKRIENAELRGSEAQREPHRRLRLGLGGGKGSGEELLQLAFLAWLGAKTDEQRDLGHGSSSIISRR